MISSTVAVVVALSTVVAGCLKPSPTAPRQPDPETNLSQVSGLGKGGNGKGGSGSGAVLMDLTLEGGMTGGPEAVPVQNDNKRELNLQGPMTGVSTAIDFANCVMMQGDPAKQPVLEALFNTGPVDAFRVVMIFDKKSSGSASDNHRLTLNFERSGGSYVVNVTEGVTVIKSGETYTFSGGYVRATDKQGPPDTAIVRCDNLSTITATVATP